MEMKMEMKMEMEMKIEMKMEMVDSSPISHLMGMVIHWAWEDSQPV